MITDTNSSLVPNGNLLATATPLADCGDFEILSQDSLSEPVLIRPYRPADRKAICDLCCDTGFLGQSADALFKDRDLFAELFTRAYLDHEPEWGIVGESGGRVVAYLLGSVRRNFDRLQMFTGFLTSSKMVWRLITGRYARHPRSRKFIRWLFTSGLAEQPRHPRHAAHLHLDIDRRFRGCGVGRRLWRTFERRLRAAGVDTCYGSFFSCPKRRPEVAYARYGFKIFDRRRTTLFAPELSDPVEVVCVSKDL